MFGRNRKGIVKVTEPELIILWPKFVNEFALLNHKRVESFPNFINYFGKGVRNLEIALLGPHFYPISGRHTRGADLQVIYNEWSEMIWEEIESFTPPDH